MAVDFPAPNIMEPGPPARSVSFLVISWPMAMKMMMGRIHVSTKLSRGEVSSTMSRVNSAPASYSRWVRSGSFMGPVL